MPDAPKPTQFNYSVLWDSIEQEATRQFITYVSRRDFIKLATTGLAGAALIGIPTFRSAAQDTAVSAVFPNQSAAGDTTQTSTVLWARSAIVGMLTFEVSENNDFSPIVATQTAEVTDVMLPAKVSIENLTPNTPYFYRITHENGESTLGRFRTPAAAGKHGLRFGVSGDWRGELRPYVALSNALERDLAFFVLHGDTIYADIPSLDFKQSQATTLADFRIKHNEVYSARYDQNFLAALRASTSVFATIDDHEVTNDFAGGAPPATDERFGGETTPYINQTALYQHGLQAFWEYNPLHDETYQNTGDDRMDGRPKLYRYQTYGQDAAVMVLDARSFRDASVEGVTNFFNPLERNRFNRDIFTPGRTFLGRTQVEDLKRDLLAAHEAGITWKFVLIPEPMQQMGWFGGNDRWEGYAPERTEVLQFIEDNAIRNVVFIAADIHSTYINKVFYQTEANGDFIPTHVFEVTTGPVAFYPPTGAATVDGAAQFNLISQDDYAAYQNLSIAEKDKVLLGLFNQYAMQLQGFEDLGLDNSLLDVELVKGEFIAGHVFGWAEFDIAPDTQILTMTTWGVPAYSPEDAANRSQAILALKPEIINQLVVRPK
jgi:phosphodiesterase/alkaline phosphatase D-like protein